MLINYHIIPHLTSVSFAIELAYIALDRFRYSNRALQFLKHAYKKIKKGVEKDNPAGEDTALLRLQKKIKDISQNGLGIECRGRRLFGIISKSGWDIYIISLFIVLNIASLFIGCFFNEHTNQLLLWIIMIIGMVGMVIPVLFIFIGKWCISKTIKYIDEEYTTASIMYEYEEPVDAFLDELRNIPYN